MIQAMFANEDSSRLLQHRDKTLKLVLSLVAEAKSKGRMEEWKT